MGVGVKREILAAADRSRVREKERGQSAKTVAEMKEGGKRLCSHPSQISIPRSCTFYFFRNYDLFSEPPLISITNEFSQSSLLHLFSLF